MIEQRKGFTIIEVVLVLAIAGLIFLMVFIALPALQRGQRDTQRRSDASTFITQVNQYSTNNRGAVPKSQDDINAFLTSYMKQEADNAGEFKDPKSGVNYSVRVDTAPTTTDTLTTMGYYPGQRCNGESTTAAGARSAAILVRLEGSGTFCTDNQGK